jgi:uncharacterized protein (TIGR03437 family)
MENWKAMNIKAACVFVCAISAWPALAQSPVWDSSGNSLLKGNYYFRQVQYLSTSAASFYGGISFDGNGNWTVSGAQTFSSNTNSTQSFSASGTYTVTAAGFGRMTSPADSTQYIYFLVANGIAFGSATENPSGYEDLFIAAPLGSPQPSVSSLNGTYQISYFRPDYYNGPASDEDAQIQMSANGSGQINASMNGYIGEGGSAVYSQVSNGLNYIYSNGAAVITFPNNSNASFIGWNGQENEYLYMSPDGNFVFGGAPNDLDIFVGVKSNGSNPSGFSGLFYQAGIDDDESQGAGAIDSWYGAFSVLTGSLGGNMLVSEHIAYGGNVGSNNTFSDTYPSSFTNGGYTNTGTLLQYVFSSNGAIRIGLGQGPYLGINVAIQAPTLNPPAGISVFLNPQGVVSSASFAPFTSGISNGELITLFGSNLAANAANAASLPLPTTLGNVTVTINGFKAPLVYVSPTQISAVVPFENTSAVADIQVTNGSTQSNVVSMPVFQTTPGVYTIDSAFGGVGPYGFGYAAAEHANYSVVSSSNPAQPGETIQLYLTGLGNVNPTIQDGAAGPANPPYSIPTNTIAVDIGGTTTAAPAFIGLAPALAGLYQINFQIPSSLTSGIYLVGIEGPDSYTDEAVIQVGSGSASASVVSKVAPRARPARLPHHTGTMSAPRRGAAAGFSGIKPF